MKPDESTQDIALKTLRTIGSICVPEKTKTYKNACNWGRNIPFWKYTTF